MTLQNTYTQKMAEMQASVKDSALNEELELKNMANQRLTEIFSACEEIVKKPVWEDFNFRTGRILGLLRFIAQNPKQRDQLLMTTGLRQEHVDIYYRVAGNLPFCDNSNLIYHGRPMNVQGTKDLVKIVAIQLGVYIDDQDLFDITEERWEKLHKNALERAIETQQDNERNAIPNGGYDE